MIVAVIDLRLLASPTVFDLILMMLNSLRVGLRGHAATQAEIIALRHPIDRVPKNPKAKAGPAQWLRPLPLGMATGLWSSWRAALIMVRPETVIGWHRQGFRGLFWLSLQFTNRECR
jgi:hypothetical protein